MTSVWNRTWTSKEGTTIVASLLDVRGSQIILRHKNKELKIPISNLSQKDRILVDEFQIKHSPPGKMDFSITRIWTNDAGQTMEATIHNASKSSVEVRKSDGKVFRYKINDLSANDQAYVKKFLLQKNSLSDDQILKRLTMYKWRDTPSGSWEFRLEFKTTKTANDWRELEWVWFSGGSRSGSWKLEPNGVIKSSFGTWQFPLTEVNNKVLKPLDYGTDILYGSTSFD